MGADLAAGAPKKTITLTLEYDPDRVPEEELRSALEWELYRFTSERALLNDAQLAWRWHPAPKVLRFHCTC